MVNNEIRKKIASLSPREREVFELVCQELTYREIGIELHMSVSAVKTHMTSVRGKFGIDQLSRRQTAIELNNTFCSALKELREQLDLSEPTEKETKDEAKPVPKSPDEESSPAEKQEIHIGKKEGEKKEKPKEDVIEKVGEKNYKKPHVQKQEKPLKEKKDGNHMKNTDQTNNDRFRSLKTIWRVVSIAAIIFSGYMIYDHFFVSTSVQPALTPEEPEVQQEQIAITHTEVIPTAEIQPTTIPTIAETSTPEPTAPPQPAVLFEDNFENGLSSGWEIVSGNPMIVNGMLTTDQDTWLMVGDPSWKNYSVEFTTDHPMSLYGLGTGFNAIGMRAQDIDNMYAFRWGQYQGEGYIVEGGNWAEIPQSDYDVSNKEINLRFTMVDGTMTVYENGVKAISFFDTRFANGKIVLKIFPEAVFDNFKIKEILE